MEHLVTTIWQYDIDARMPATLPAPTPYSQVPLSPCLSHRMAEPRQCGAGAPSLPLRTRAPAPNVCRTTMREFRAAPNATTHVLCPVPAENMLQGRRIPDERRHFFIKGPTVCLTLQLPVWRHEQVLWEEVLALPTPLYTCIKLNIHVAVGPCQYLKAL